MSLAEPGVPWPDWLANNLQKSRADCQHSEHRPAATAGFSAVEMWTHNPACLSLLERKWKHLYGQILFFQAWGTWNVKRMARRGFLSLAATSQQAGLGRVACLSVHLLDLPQPALETSHVELWWPGFPKGSMYWGTVTQLPLEWETCAAERRLSLRSSGSQAHLRPTWGPPVCFLISELPALAFLSFYEKKWLINL